MVTGTMRGYRRGVAGWWRRVGAATLLPLSGVTGIVGSTVGCRASLQPRVEERTSPIGVVYREQLHVSRGAYSRLGFGSSPPQLRLLIEETRVGSFGPFALELEQEGGTAGTMLLGDRNLEVIEATPLEKNGRTSTMLLTVAVPEATSRVVPAELVAVGWPDRGRWFRRFGKPLARAATQDRIEDLGEAKAEFRAAMGRELASATLLETATGFQIAHAGQETRVDLARMLDITERGQARAALSRLATLARYAVSRSEDGSARPPVSPRAASVLCLLGPEAPFATLSREERAEMISRTVAPGVVGVFVQYSPDHVDLLSPSMLPALGVEGDELAALAAKNQLGVMGPIYRIDIGSGVFLLSTAGFYDASLALVPEIWAEMDPLLAGDRVVAVPDQDTLLVTGANNSQGVELLLAAARRAPDSENPVAAHLLVWRNGAYERSRAR